MSKQIALSNDRGYLFVKKVPGSIDMSKTVSFDIDQAKDSKKTSVHLHLDESGKHKAGNMIRNGYLQVGEYLGKNARLTVGFRERAIFLDIATDDEVAAFNKMEEEADAKRKAEKKTVKTSENVAKLEQLEKDGLIKKVTNGKSEHYEYVKSYEIKKDDTVVSLRKSGTYRVTEINPKTSHVTAEDVENKSSHHFLLAELAPTK